MKKLPLRLSHWSHRELPREGVRTEVEPGRGDISVGASSLATAVEMVLERLRQARSSPETPPVDRVATRKDTSGHAHRGKASDRVVPADTTAAYVHGRSAPAGSCRDDLRVSSARRGSGADNMTEVMARRGTRNRTVLRPPWRGSGGGAEKEVPGACGSGSGSPACLRGSDAHAQPGAMMRTRGQGARQRWHHDWIERKKMIFFKTAPHEVYKY